MKPKADYSLHLITDRALASGRPLEYVVESAVRGGATLVQLREKDCPTEEFKARARSLRHLTRAMEVPLIINDNIEVALAVEADGVHLGQSDASWQEARERLGDEAIIGLSAGTPKEVLDAREAQVDYLGVGPIFPTQTKPDASAPWGVEGMKAARATSHHTLVAIGGINAFNAGEVVRAGADGVAVVSAICAAADVREAAERLRAAVDEARL